VEKEIKIKITLDGKELFAMMQLAKTDVEELTKLSQQFSSSPMLKQFAKDLLAIDTVSEQATEGIIEFVKYNNISERQIEEVVRALQEEKATLGATSNEWKQHQTALANISNAYERLRTSQNTIPNAQGRVNTGLSSMNMLMGQTGFLLSDLDMMFVNTRMGLMSISNNISMVAQTAANAAAQARTAGQTFTQAFAASLTPMNLMVLGVNAVMLVMQMLARISSDTTKGLSKQTDEVKRLKSEYESLTKQQLENKSAEVESELIKMTSEMGSKYGKIQEIMKATPGGAYIGSWLNYFGLVDTEMTKEEKEKYNMLMNEKKALDEVAAKHGFIKEIEAQRSLWMEKRSQLDEEHIHAYDKVISYYDSLIEKANKNIKAKTEEKTIYEQLHITSKQELETELAKYQALLKNEKIEYNRLAIKEKILAIEEELLRFNKKDDPISRYLSSIGEGNVNDRIAKYIDYSQEGIDNKKIDDHIARSTGEKYDPNYDYLAHGSQMIDTEDKTKKITSTTQLLGQVWQRTGNIIASSLTRGLGLMKQTDNILKNILGNLAEMALQMGLQGLMGGLFALLPGGGGFSKGFFGALGISKSLVPSTPLTVSGMSAAQYLVVEVKGTSEIRSNDIVQSYSGRNAILQKYYGKKL
jgi:ABC-type cobalt transport system substrate-binding protein